MADYYQGNSVFTSLSSIFGSSTSGNTAQPVPVTSDFFGKVEGFMKKRSLWCTYLDMASYSGGNPVNSLFRGGVKCQLLK